MNTNDPKSSITAPSPSQRAEQSTLFGRRRTERGPRRSPGAEHPVSNRIQANKIHPALKHAGYSATSLLPGEDPAAFEKLHRDLIADFTPVGVLQECIVAYMARLIWRKENLATFWVAELARRRREQIIREKVPHPDLPTLGGIDPAEEQEGYQAAEEQARQELGDTYELIDIGKPATIDGLIKQLAIEERLDGLISRCLKQLLLARGVKSVSQASSSASTPQISGPRKAD
jgi:hypothetical protein